MRRGVRRINVTAKTRINNWRIGAAAEKPKEEKAEEIREIGDRRRMVAAKASASIVAMAIHQ